MIWNSLDLTAIVLGAATVTVAVQDRRFFLIVWGAAIVLIGASRLLYRFRKALGG